MAGKNCFEWIGSTPRVNISNPEDVKDIFTKYVDFQKRKSNPLTKLLATGLTTYEDAKWVKHRRIINPAFHLQKLKVFINLILIIFFLVTSICILNLTN